MIPLMLNLAVDDVFSSLAFVLVSVETLDSDCIVPLLRDIAAILPWSLDDEELGGTIVGVVEYAGELIDPRFEGEC
jgi:hypothetical protein